MGEIVVAPIYEELARRGVKFEWFHKVDALRLSAGKTAIDRIGPEWHDLSKRAKDMGSAAVLLSLVLAGGIWAAAIASRFF